MTYPPNSENKPVQRTHCGGWTSPITAELIVSGSTPIEEIAIVAGDVFWTERRPREGGRTTLMQQRRDGAIVELTHVPFNVRSRVHEYGGGAFSASAATVFCCAAGDQRIHWVPRGDAPVALTSTAGMRYADMLQDPSRNRLIAVREDHSVEGREPVNTLVQIDITTGNESVLTTGHDFYSSPALSPDGHSLSWLTWDHPRMPWDGTDLWLATIADDGTLQAPQHIAGGTSESIFQPCWSPRGELHFISDKSGWWNLYRHRNGNIEPLHPMDADFGMPQWAFGMRTYGFDALGNIVCAYVQNGDWELAWLDAESGELEDIATSFRNIRRLAVEGNAIVVLGGGSTAPECIVHIDLDSGAERIVRTASSAEVDPGAISHAEAITFPTTHGLSAHAFHYAPTNAAFKPIEGEKPPLIVISHGGPTGATSAAFSWAIQYWTSRGFAVVDVNYGGSSGYGRAYRERLKGQWGVVDVDDAVNAARYLVARGDVDGDRVAIRGSSAGGYTTLCALTFRDYFKAGASHYGIGDLESLATDTHKFESRYLDSLIGPYPEARALYRERSPIHFTERLWSPMILFQGADDKAVPPNQAQAMYEAVRAKGLPVAYLLFEGEGHGFRRAENIRRALEAELYFYGRIFGFTPADVIEPVPIDNLPRTA